MDKRNILDRFIEKRQTQPDALCLWVEGRALRYSEVEDAARSIAGALRSSIEAGGQEPVAFVADRSLVSYLAMLAAAWIGVPFVPLHPRHPIARHQAILDATGCRVLVTGASGAPAAIAMLAEYNRPITVLWADKETAPPMEFETMGHRVTRSSSTGAMTGVSREIPASHRIAYILFTSGSTGTPKGVAVSHANLLSYVDFIIDTYGPGPSDRFSQVFDQTFDLAMHDIFVSLSAGASLHVVSSREQLSPGKFIQQRELTFWFSTPSTAAIMHRSGALAPGNFPGLRHSLFCGEALPFDIVSAWARAAPNSSVENLYGPTEATIAISRFAVRTPVDQGARGIVPIGHPFDGQVAALCHDGERYVAPTDGAEGELILSGDQVTLGYWRDEERTALAFRTDIQGDPQGRRWYKTGDWVRYESQNGFLFLGRKDEQVKIRGHRVELTEIEAAMRHATGSALVAVLAWPRSDRGAEGVVGFVCGSTLPEREIQERCAELMPSFMVPRRVIELEAMPLNTSGKTDKKALLEMLEAERK